MVCPVKAWSRGAADELIGALARERDVLEVLLFRLTAARQLLQTGSPRFLARVADDITRATEIVREAESRRVAVTAAVMGALDELPSQTMRELVARAPDPYRSVLDDHRTTIGRLAAEVVAVAETAQELARAGRARLQDEVWASGPLSGDELEQALERELSLSGYDALLAATSPLVLPALSTFLS